MTIMDRLKFAIIGAGCVAQNYAEAFRKCQSAEVDAIVDINLDAASKMAALLGCRYYGDIESLSVAQKIDAVVICTPPSTHEAVCLYFLERGVHVCCEKPLATNSQSARKMIEYASRTGAILTMASKFRHVEDVIQAKKLVKEGVIGEIGLFENAFMSEVDMSARWNSDPRISGGGVLIDNGTHSVDIMRYLFGPIASVRAIEGNREKKLAVEETVHICARNCEGTVGRIDLSWSVKNNAESFIRLYGSQGTLEVGWKQSRYRCSLDSEWTIFGKGYDKGQAFLTQINDFCDAISGRKRLRVKEPDMLASVDVIEAGYLSLNLGTWIAVKDVIPKVWEIHANKCSAYSQKLLCDRNSLEHMAGI